MWLANGIVFFNSLGGESLRTACKSEPHFRSSVFSSE